MWPFVQRFTTSNRFVDDKVEGEIITVNLILTTKQNTTSIRFVDDTVEGEIKTASILRKT